MYEHELNIEAFEVDVKEINHNSELKVCQHDDELTVSVPSALTATEATAFACTVGAVVSSTHSLASLDLDFSHTDFIDSSGLGALVRVIKNAKQAGCEVFASGFNEAVGSMFVMTRLDRLVQLRLESVSR